MILYPKQRRYQAALHPLKLVYSLIVENPCILRLIIGIHYLAISSFLSNILRMRMKRLCYVFNNQYSIRRKEYQGRKARYFFSSKREYPPHYQVRWNQEFRGQQKRGYSLYIHFLVCNTKASLSCFCSKKLLLVGGFEMRDLKSKDISPWDRQSVLYRGFSRSIKRDQSFIPGCVLVFIPFSFQLL